MADDENKTDDQTKEHPPSEVQKRKAEPQKNSRFEKWMALQNEVAKLGGTIHDQKKFDAALNAVRNAAK